MPESKRRKKRSFVPSVSRSSSGDREVFNLDKGTPRWWTTVMVTLMVIGLAWIVTAYITRLDYPVPGIGAWNIAAGFGVALIGFGMTTRWR